MKLLANFKYFLLRKARLLAKAIITSLLVCVLLQTGLVTAQAAEKFCSDYNGVIDGLVDPVPTQITIDRDCTFQNYPASNPLTSTLNFHTNDPSIYLIVFNNVIFTGHMACANVEHRIWFANGSDYGSSNSCQDLFIPVESIDKQAPAPTASIGEPFTYTLTFPSMTVVGGPSLNDLHSVAFWDDLTATGADLRFVGINAYYESSGIPVALRRETNPLAPGGRWTPTNLSYKLFDNDAEFIPAGEQVVVEITVVPLDSTTNLAGTTFINTAKWSFGRLIDDVYYEPLPGEWGISAPMTIVEPELLVTKSSNETALNLGVPATYTIDVHNAGGGTAWNVTLEDQLPREMCDVDPATGTAFSASIIDADGALVADLLPGDDFSTVFDGSPRCSLQLTMLSDRARIAHDQHLVISYQSQLDADVTTDGLTLINVAGATEWFSTDPVSSETRTYRKRLTDGTPSILDHEDNQVITTALSGYYFQKTVANLTSGVNPATTALPGDRLRYRLRLFNVDETINAISINDTLDLSHFNPGSFTMVSLPASATYNFNQSTGELSVTGSPDQLNVAVGEEIIIEFEVTLVSPLGNGTRVENQATLTAAGINALSDDPYVNGIAPPDGNPPPDPTTIVVESPGALIKTSNRTSATIGEQFSYTITIPETTLGVPMYDVRIVDNLLASDADMRFLRADVVSGHSWTLTNTGTDSAPVIVDMFTGIDIPAGERAVINITVALENSLTNQAGQIFNNRADYSFNRLNGVESTRTTGGSGFSENMTVVEPHIGSITKNADNPTPTAGEIVRYSVALSANGGANASDVFDITLTDSLETGLVYVGNPSVTTGSGVGADNTIGEPIVTGNGSTSPQVLLWAPSENNIDIDIAKDEVITVSYDVRVSDSVLANQVLANSVVAQWTGLDGANPDERDGSDGIGGLNDYITPEALATVATPGISATLAKNRLSDTFGPGDASVRIGDLIEYELRISVAEGTLGNLELVDTLPRGLEYAGIVSINGNTGPAPYAAVAPFSHADFVASGVTVAGDPAAGPSTVTWAFGNLTNLPNDGANDDFVIVYRAQVLDEVFALDDLNIPLNNTVTMTYNTATGSVTQSDGDTVINALQPQLAVSKGSDPAGGSSIAAGDIVTYTVDVLNSGNAPAYDAVIQDVLPSGLRQGGVTTTSITLVTAGSTLPVLTPTYDPATGTVTWNFDTGTADAYTIPAGETLRLVYTVQADATLGPGLELTNTALATSYYSFDDEAVPANATVDQREVYGPSNTASTTLYTDSPIALQKVATQTSASVGELFTYQVTVPPTPQPTALNDVRIIDDLSASAADISFVSVARVDDTQPWVPVNTGDEKNLIIEDVTTGIDIPAYSQAIIEITVSLDDTINNVSGLVFSNTADYTFNQVNDDPSTETPGLPGSSGNMTISGPDSMTLVKSGPTTMRLGLPETFTIDVQNTGNAPAWDLTITDKLPDPFPGGMCESAPANITAQIFASNGTDAISPVLVQDSDYTVSFAGAPDCTLTVTMQSATAAIGPGERLIVTYDAKLDQGSTGGTSLTNVAAATEWFSGDTIGSGATGSVRIYTGTLSNGTVGTSDEQDAHTLLTETPVLIFRKSVVNLSTGQNPGANAEPGDTLQYTIRIENISSVELPEFSIVDELDALNTMPAFVPGSLRITSTLPTGAVDNTDANGGVAGTGRIEIGNLSLDAVGGTNTEAEIRFEVTLFDVLDSGFSVLNQAELFAYGVPLAVSDDPNVNRADDPQVNGDEDPTRTLISSAPLFEVWKTSDDVTDDPALLRAGDVLRYTITVKNVGSEHAVNTFLQDQIPANTSYVDNSTTLNGNPVPDPTPGTSPLQSGLSISAPDDSSPGSMPANSADTLDNVATITFAVQVDNNAVDGAVIANQSFVRADGAGSGPAPEEPSDDPDTVVLDDPTRDVVGSVPLVDAQKTVQLLNDATGIVDPGDVLQYTIVISNTGAVPATGVVFIDQVPANTSYVEDTALLNSQPVGRPDNGISPLATGIDISSSDLPMPLPGSGNGTLMPGETAVITFDVVVNPGVATGTIISNQGVVSSTEQPDEPTDADGNDTNGDQPTETVVGNVEQLAMVKDVLVVGGGAVLPGSQLEYVLRATNIGSRPVTSLLLTDDLVPLTGLASYIDGSASMDGSVANVTYTGSVLRADFGNAFGSLPVGDSTVLRFRVQVETDVAIGTTITNTGAANWGETPRNTTASVSVVVGGSPGSISLNGAVWHDTNYDELADEAEQSLEGWTVELSRNGRVVDNTLTDNDGDYRFTGVAPNASTTELYELRFIAPGAGPNTPSLGIAASPLFTNGPQRISEIYAVSGEFLAGLNLPITPNGVVYNSVARTPVAGATLTLVSAANGVPLPTSCFEDPVQQNQVTPLSGYYKFDLNFNNSACPPNADYLIEVASPSGYSAMPSQVIPPGSGAATAPFSVPACPESPDDALPATTDICEVVASSALPPLSVDPGTQGTSYYMHLTLGNGAMPRDSQIFNNHLPIDPVLDGVVAISKTSPLINVTKGQLVPYTITVSNRYSAPLSNLSIIDIFPAGFKYVEGSGRIDGTAREPSVAGRQLTWDGIDLQVNEKHTLQLLLLVGSGVTEDEYVNQALIFHAATGSQVSGIATATVRVIPDPTFDCTDIIGKVFDDRNLSGQQEQGEEGLPGVQVVTARGLIGTTDQYGRFHITCAIVPDEDRGSNFILKLDDHTLPTGYRLSTENPRVQRVTRGKMMKFNFGATIHRVVSVDFADGVFEPEKTELRVQWHAKLRVLIEELKKAPSVLRLSYLADVERENLVHERLEALRDEIAGLWDLADGGYPLSVETEVFWRRGGPP